MLVSIGCERGGAGVKGEREVSEVMKIAGLGPCDLIPKLDN